MAARANSSNNAVLAARSTIHAPLDSLFKNSIEKLRRGRIATD